MLSPPVTGAGVQPYGSFFTAFPGTSAGSGSEVEQLLLDLEPLWDAGLQAAT